MNLLSLEEYERIAQKIINREIGPRFITDDNVGEVIEKLIYADIHFDPAKSSLNNFRYHSAKIVIRRIMYRLKKLKNKPISLSHNIYSSLSYNDDDALELSDVIPAQEPPPQINVRKLIENSGIKERKKEFLIKRFIEDKPVAEIAQEYNITSTAAYHYISESITSLKEDCVKNKQEYECVLG